jgi:transposase InsO family protein
LITGPAREAKPFSHARIVLRRFRKEVFLAGFAAEAQAPMVVGDKTKLSTTVCTTVVQFGHELSSDWRYDVGRPNGDRPVQAEVIHRRGLWRWFDALEYATLEWVDWFNNRRLLEPIGNIPPAEAEANYYATLEEPRMVA